MGIETIDIVIMLLKAILIWALIVQVVPVMIWVERKGAALIQDRPGPNRIGPFGLFQPIADVIKFLFKEDPIPKNVNRVLYVVGPFISLIPASLIIAVLPIGDYCVIGGRRILLQVTELDVGILFLLATSSLGVYGLLFGGWSSNNKYSLMGALRSASQVISYEVPLALTAVTAVMWYGTFSLREMTYQQEGLLLGVLPNWGIFYLPFSFLLMFISLFAETNRLPFDLPEAEAELVGGFHTEYGSMKFATFFMAEYMNMATASGVMTALFFGGWHLPYISDATLLAWVNSHNLLALIQVSVFLAKVAVFMLIFVWIRWTIPRFRFDQLMSLAWGSLIPLALLNVVVTAVLMYFWRTP